MKYGKRNEMTNAKRKQKAQVEIYFPFAFETSLHLALQVSPLPTDLNTWQGSIS